MSSEGGPPRITAGMLRGRIVLVPQTGGVRPMLARTRQALFNVLGNEIEGPVWDCFGGSGLLAFEALSRGATHAVIIESDARHARVIEQNIDGLGIKPACTLRRGNTFNVVKGGMDPAQTPAGLVFVDPPHAMAVDPASQFWPWLRALSDTPLVGPETTVVFGHPAGMQEGDFGHLRVRDRREYGTVAFTLLSR